MQKMAYRPDIDGLRALAVIAVVMFHLGNIVPGGFVGVDIFFVISGFLITSIIRFEIANDRFSLTKFWERRIRRIFPALTVVIATTLAVGYFLLTPNELKSLGESSLAQAAMVANIYFANNTGYFAGPAEQTPLLQTWSLAVEEQFYLFFPLLLIVLQRFSRRKTLTTLSLMAAISFAASIFYARITPEVNFFSLPTRAWELLIGCLLAVTSFSMKPHLTRDSAISGLALAMLLLPLYFYTSETPFPGVAAIPPVVGTATLIFIHGVNPQLATFRILSLAPIRFIGLISYSLYLWHWPVIVYIRMYFGHLSWKQTVLASGLSALLALLSWKFIEIPCRKNMTKLRGPFIFKLAATATCLIILASLSLIWTNGLAKFRFHDFQIAHQVDATWNGDEFASHARISEDQPITNTLVTIGKEGTPDEMRLDFFLWGDSHGLVLSKCLDNLAKQVGLTGKAYLQHSFAPLFNVQRTDQPKSRVYTRQRIKQYLINEKPRNLILVCRWSGYAGYQKQSDWQAYTPPYVFYDTRFPKDKARNRNLILQQNLIAIAKICSANGIKLWIVKQVPETGEKTPARSYLRYTYGLVPHLSNQRRSKDQHDEQQLKAEILFHSLPKASASFVDPAPYLFDPSGMTINYQDDRALYRDQDHLSLSGVEYTCEAFADMFRKIKESKAIALNSSHGTSPESR